jgi:hypothetical protein
MPDNDLDPLTEGETVRAWREAQLIRAGYLADDAITLAATQCDLHQAAQLLAWGCDEATAVNILR